MNNENFTTTKGQQSPIAHTHTARIVPLHRGTRALVFCEYMEDFNDEQNLLLYTLALEAVFAGKDGYLTQPYAARVYQYANYEEGV